MKRSDRTCPICGGKVPVLPAHRVTCSRVCSIVLNRLRARARHRALPLEAKAAYMREYRARRAMAAS